jgi:hypothetical protein
MAVRETAAHFVPFHAGATPNTTVTSVGRASFHWTSSVFGVRSNSAPAMAEFHGKTVIAWSDDSTGTLHVACVVGKGPNYQLKPLALLPGDVSPGRSPALATLNGCLFMAWTEPTGKVDVICSTDGVHFANKVTLAARSADSPTLAAFNGRLYVGFTGTNGKLNIESSANGMRFGNYVTLAASSFYSPALAAFNGRLYLAWTAPNEQLSFDCSADGTAFGNEVIPKNYTSAAAPALTCENPGPKGQPARLIAGVTDVADTGIWLLDMTKRLANPKATVPPTHFYDGSRPFALNGLSLVSPSAGTLDLAWTSGKYFPHQLNFLPVSQWIN